MKKIILIFLVLALTLPICASADSSVTIDGVDFNIPEAYIGGNMTNNTYIVDSPYTFEIMSLGEYKNLRFNFGYDSLDDEVISVNETSIGDHSVVAIHANKTICDHDVITVYFQTGDTIFKISYNGSQITPEIEKIINNTPKSSVPSDVFYNELVVAQEGYVEDIEKEEKTIELEQAFDSAYEKKERDDSRFFFYYHKYN